MRGELATVHGELVDAAAVKIGELYELGRKSLLESTQHLIECGRLLVEKKASMAHGQWLPWLAANAGVLGFESRQTASRLMKGAESNGALTSHFDEAQAVTLNRQIWGNTNREAVELS